MAMYIAFRRKLQTRVSNQIWYVGAEYENAMDEGDTLIDVQADGHEREFVERYFTGLRGTRNTRGVIWSGDDAKFIVVNLKRVIKDTRRKAEEQGVDEVKSLAEKKPRKRSMRCPMCAAEMTFVAGEEPFICVEERHQAVSALTACCSTMYRLTPHTGFTAVPSSFEEDDWGNKVPLKE